ncbi:MAG TPA: DNA-directed RNA polymerase subunit omega [Candidatus Hydrogenedens sp.]|nr:DNA-directed RNA polymerase subunit omega [Candidatus Hydrogenedens sp.]HOL20558.1 DNA-directed RNA polymerase subunit omega [Candidatus Hydrogenedens sp.]HPP59926.1 DNA-directed RNA polymerase subunit omega [Candidatus Hydrogenedens sp.]
MPAPFYVDELRTKIDSLYRLVIVSTKRVNQIMKSEKHAFGKKKKPTILTLEEFMDGKITYRKNEKDDLTEI